MIQNITITANSSSALVSWITQEGPLLKIDLTYILLIFSNLEFFFLVYQIDQAELNKFGIKKM